MAQRKRERKRGREKKKKEWYGRLGNPQTVVIDSSVYGQIV